MTARNVPPQQVTEFKITATEQGQIRMKVYDRITVDDVTLHLINQSIYNILTKEDPTFDVSRNFKDFLVMERYRVR